MRGLMVVKELVYLGILRETAYGEGDALFIGDSEEPIADVLQSEISRKLVNVQFWISDIALTKAELKSELVRKLYGEAEVEYIQHYSDYTGYLWTDEELKVGGHDLLAELRGYEGKYIYLEILVHDYAV
jgi:hypothetical protein